MHTKGPWTAEWDEYGGYDCMWGAYIIKDKNKKEITVLDDNGPNKSTANFIKGYTPPNELTNNAHLIAAAPELLTIVENLLATFGGELSTPSWEEIDDTINKAKGLSTD